MTAETVCELENGTFRNRWFSELKDGDFPVRHVSLPEGIYLVYIVYYIYTVIYIYLYITLWLFNVAMENGPSIDGLPHLKMVIFHGYDEMSQMYSHWIIPQIVMMG